MLLEKKQFIWLPWHMQDSLPQFSAMHVFYITGYADLQFRLQWTAG